MKRFKQIGHFNKRLIIRFALISMTIVVVIVAAWLKIVSKQGDSVCDRCNVVVIDIDILRADALDCVTHFERTPNICRFFKDGVFLKNHISHSNYTRPSFVSFMTSLYPSSHMIWDTFHRVLNVKVSHIADILEEKGYESFLLWKKETIQLNSEWFDKAMSYDDGFKKLESQKIIEPLFIYYYNEALHFPNFLKSKHTEEQEYPGISVGIPKSLEEWEEVQKDYIAKNYKDVFKSDILAENSYLFDGNIEANKDKIFQLFNSYAYDVDKRKHLKDEWMIRYKSFVQYIDTNNASDVSYLKSKYLQILSDIDDELSDLFRFLEKIKNKTIVVLRSDHGEEFFEHGQFAHQNKLYQELIHTPLVIWYPGGKKKHIDEFSQDIDIVPTILDLLGIKRPDFLQGESLMPLMRGLQKYTDPYQIAQQGNVSAAFRSGEWKMIIAEGKEPDILLFNLSNDPKEQQNLASRSSNIKRLMVNKYKDTISRYPVYALPQIHYPTGIDEEKKKRLIKEGYF